MTLCCLKVAHWSPGFVCTMAKTRQSDPTIRRWGTRLIRYICNESLWAYWTSCFLHLFHTAAVFLHAPVVLYMRNWPLTDCSEMKNFLFLRVCRSIIVPLYCSCCWFDTEHASSSGPGREASRRTRSVSIPARSGTASLPPPAMPGSAAPRRS